MKQSYVAPKISSVKIQLEQGIAAGSVRVSPQDNGDEIFEEYYQDEDDNRILDWSTF